MKLQLKQVGQDTNIFDVTSGRINIGREQSNDLVLNDPTVSGFHAAIFNENSICTIVDLGSSNGTLVNGQPLSGKTVVNPTDTVSFGNQHFQLIDPNASSSNKTQLLDVVQEPVKTNSNPRKSFGQLILKKGQGPEVIELVRDITVGRSTENDIVLNDTMISGSHAGFIVSENGIKIYDADSTNGTFVNGQHISQSKTSIYDGDIVSFDEVTYTANLPSHPKTQESIAKTSVRQFVTESSEEAPSAALTEIKDAQVEEREATKPKVLVQSEKIFPVDIKASNTGIGNEKQTIPNDEVSKVESSTKQPTQSTESKNKSDISANSGTADKVNKPIDEIVSNELYDRNKTNVQQPAVNTNFKPSTDAPPPPPPLQSKQEQNHSSELNDSGQKGLKWLLTSYDGRIKRSKFWASILSLLVVFLLAQFLLAAMVYGDLETGMQAMQLARTMQFASLSPVFNIGYIGLSLLALFFTSAIYTKRLHDRGRTGWLTLLIFVPYITTFLILATNQPAFGLVNLVISLYLLVELGCLKGQLSDNKYGRSPYTQSSSGK
ncbi:FHA domain-containing protein [Alteromonas hispanica]|uniref:FHA domain-containing protein n=1 Tax=Alteromonas hispanica TaxID=315421 RepID=A0A6L9MSN9_9ALTE|nr:FHA domain-containing protein [Alteromonas hispanica]NDW21192.1 FHA domain-containing protein [Alteromonas hispanica]